MMPIDKSSIKGVLKSMGALLLADEDSTTCACIYNGVAYTLFVNTSSVVSISRKVTLRSYDCEVLKDAVSKADQEASMCRLIFYPCDGVVELTMTSLGSSLEHFIATFEKSLSVIQQSVDLLMEFYGDAAGGVLLL